MGHGLLHQSDTPGRIGALLARSKDSHGHGEKVGVAESNAPRDVRRVQVNLLYLEIRRGTQVAQGRGLQNLHSWVRIPPAPPSSFVSAVPVTMQLCRLSQIEPFLPFSSIAGILPLCRA